MALKTKLPKLEGSTPYEPTTFHSTLCPHCEAFMASARSEAALYDGLLEHVDAAHPEESKLSRRAIQ